MLIFLRFLIFGDLNLIEYSFFDKIKEEKKKVEAKRNLKTTGNTGNVLATRKGQKSRLRTL